MSLDTRRRTMTFSRTNGQPLGQVDSSMRVPERLPVLPQTDRPAILLSPDYVILDANEAYEAHYGKTVEIGRARCHEVSHGYRTPCDQNGERCPLKQSLDSKKKTRVFHVHDGPHGPEHVDVELTPVVGEDGSIRAFVEVIQPISEASANVSGTFVGRSPAFQQLVELVRRAAPSDVSVLLLGESGTGKELAARAIHAASAQREGPFVPVECSGLTETLFESELFGHTKGAFTGAHRDRAGLVEAASSGTLFLDEVGDIPPALQVKLLRLLESGMYRRVGETEPRRADFRLVLATSQNLGQMVEEGTFRKDLYYRINTFPIDLPPLRDRAEDVPLIAQALLRETGKRLTARAAAHLSAHTFPGNVRELKNLLERATLLTDDDEIDVDQLPELTEITPPGLPNGAWPWGDAIIPLAEVERRYVTWSAKRFEGNRRGLAQALGVSERTLYRKLSK